jgi:hypothetical protein
MWMFFWVMFAVVVGVFAANKGRSGVGWFLLSLLISPLLGFLFVAVLSNLKEGAASHAVSAAQPGAATHVRCPACAEWVLPQAAVCKHCGAALTPDTTFEARQAAAKRLEKESESTDLLIGIGAVVAIVMVVALVSNCGG